MDLISGNTYWPSTLEHKLDFPSLTEDLTCDVLIVGGWDGWVNLCPTAGRTTGGYSGH